MGEPSPWERAPVDAKFQRKLSAARRSSSSTQSEKEQMHSSGSGTSLNQGAGEAEDSGSYLNEADMASAGIIHLSKVCLPILLDSGLGQFSVRAKSVHSYE